MESNEDDPYDSPSCNGAKASKSNGFRNYSDMPVNTIEQPEKILLEETRCCARSKVFTEKTSDQRLQVMERDFLAAQRACFKQLWWIQSIVADKADIPALQQDKKYVLFAFYISVEGLS